jgi:hypothetical protein
VSGVASMVVIASGLIWNVSTACPRRCRVIMELVS